MADINEFEEYEITDADIEKVMRYLKTVDPEHATSNDAIAFLEYYRVKLHLLIHQLTDEQMLELYNEFAQKRDTKED